MSPEAMRKLELFVLKNDMDLVLETLGRARCFELAEPRRAEGERRAEGDSRVEAGLDKLRKLRDLLDLKAPTLVPDGARLPGAREDALLDELVAGAEGLSSEIAALEARRGRVREALVEARAFAGLSLPFKELDHLSFLAVRIGRVPPSEVAGLSSRLGDRAILIPLGEDGSVVAAASKKGRFALDTELERAKFRPRELPADFKGLPPELVASLEAEHSSLDAEASRLEARKAEFRAAAEGRWESLAASYAVLSSIERAKEGLESSDFVYRFEGWVPRDRAASLVKELGAATSGRTAARIYVPEELDSVHSGEEKVPVLLKRRPFVSSFEGLVVSYGAPLYGTIDPTPLVAFFFVVLFAIMFGDLGQGAVILLAGLVLGSGKAARLAKWKAYGPIFVAVGLGSMVMGLLDGTVFANEEWLVPLSRAVSLALLGRPLDRFVQIMPSGGSVEKLFAFFGFTLGVGVLINSVGLVVNIVNKWRLGKKGEALFAKTGLAGALFFWWAIGLGIRAAAGGRPSWIDIPGLALPLAALFLEEPLGRLVEGRKRAGKGDGGLAFAIKGFVEVIESISYYFSNTLSFLRVGAFALSHAVLSFIVFAMGDLVGERAPAGLLWEIVVVIIGNAVIIVLEGMIVAIQVVRLQYYEFFSKFFTETGTLFAPFRFEYPKE